MGTPFFKYEIISWHFIGLGMEGGRVNLPSQEAS